MEAASNIGCYDSNSSYSGLTYGQWTVLWWRWALATPAKKNPVVDQSGLNASEGQPKGVWFLAGIFGDGNKDMKFPIRCCNIPAGVPVLIPVLNCEADSIEYPDIRNDQDIINHVLNQVDSIEKKDCYVNGKRIAPERVPSDPRIFDIWVHPDFDKFHKGGGSSKASADGYWVFLKHLPVGQNSIHFAGSCENGSINSGATYELTVVRKWV